MSHHHHNSLSRHSQTQKLRFIELSRKGKSWLKRILVVVVVVMAIAVALSYVFVTKENAPENLEVPEKGFHGVF